MTIKRDVRLKNIALPIEHGSWGFLFEPLLAGLLIAPSTGSLWITLLVVGAFLARQPLKVLLSDWIAKRDLPQTLWAAKFTLIYATIAWLGALGCLLFVSINSFYPFLFIIPLAIFQIYCDASKKSRQLWPELTGALAISSSVTVVALAGGVAPAVAYSLWAVFAARLIPSILYVRNRLRLEKGKTFSVVSVAVANFAALAAVSLLAANNLIPKLPIVMFLILAVRSLWGLSPWRKRVKAMKIGVWEVIYGTLTALSVVIGYHLGL